MKSKAPLMLMEQIVMLLVFAIAAALCVQAFVKSDGISKRSEARDRAVIEVQTAAETLRHYGGDFSKTADDLGFEAVDEGFRAYFDREWSLLSPSQAEECEYELTAQETESAVQNLGEAQVSVTRRAEDEPLFSVGISWQEVSSGE